MNLFCSDAMMPVKSSLTNLTFKGSRCLKWHHTKRMLCNSWHIDNVKPVHASQKQNKKMLLYSAWCDWLEVLLNLKYPSVAWFCVFSGLSLGSTNLYMLLLILLFWYRIILQIFPNKVHCVLFNGNIHGK